MKVFIVTWETTVVQKWSAVMSLDNAPEDIGASLPVIEGAGNGKADEVTVADRRITNVRIEPASPDSERQ